MNNRVKRVKMTQIHFGSLGNLHFSQAGFEDFPGRISRQCWKNDHFARDFVVGQFLLDEVLNLPFFERGTLGGGHKSHGLLPSS
jgi:hypothetical protein